MEKKQVSWVGVALAIFALGHVVNLIIDKQDSDISPELKQQISDTILAHRPPSPANNFFTATPDNLQVADDSTKIRMPAKLAQVSQIYSNLSAFAALKQDGTVVAWGDAECGGDINNAQEPLVNVKRLYAAEDTCGFAALTHDGKLIPWGMGDEFMPWTRGVRPVLNDVRDFVMAKGLYAAIKQDGSVVSWSFEDAATAELSSGKHAAPAMTNVVSISVNYRAFAALKRDGTVVTWGQADYGGDSRQVASELNNVKLLYANNNAFTAMTATGRLVSWGKVRADQKGREQVAKLSQLKPAVKVVNTDNGFAALLADGSVYTWGEGELTEYHVPFPARLSQPNRANKVIDIFANHDAFAALTISRQLIVWGSKFHGADTSVLKDKLQSVHQVYPFDKGFVALRNDNTAIAWEGWELVEKQPRYQEVTQVSKVVTYGREFAFLKQDGAVVDGHSGPKTDITQATDIFPTGLGFTVKHQDGSIAVWMGDDSAVTLDKQAVDLSQMRDIRSNLLDAIALMADGTVQAWNMMGFSGQATQ
ncbi:hypothetical protein [Shewanella putrefaciens]|uniref:hypothetical protein n=1 Tax=Shewanella putrefaciens TaxID=24 RepID=UPI00285DD8E6|nr:hypothetical protein [Shewanella putrefaciens]MDR6963277.1 alpha-tubulin suppressor-like RCC1 family protein [Shewanella putrefaciens]